MNKTVHKYIAVGCLALGLGFVSCTGDLDMTPNDPNNKTELTNGDEFYSFFAQLYSGLVVSGPQGGSDIAVDDGGAGTYMRQLWNLEELCSDEAFIGTNWNDAGIKELDNSTWAPDNHWLYESYSRFTFQINMCNEFIRTIDKAASCENPISADKIAEMKLEARVVRDLSYYHLIDNFGKGPWTDENSAIGVTPPTKTRAELFDLVVADLKDAVPNLTPAASQIYGRVSREAGYMLLAKMYLNAEVYTGTAKWQECADACNEILKTISSLTPTYKYMFCATNNKYAGNGEILWALPQDASSQQTHGGTTYLSIGAYNVNVDASTYGLNATGWGGPRVRPELANSFSKGDSRYLIYEGKFKNDLSNTGDWKVDGGSGFMCIKYVFTPETDYYNATKATKATTFNSTDFPLFRLADTYLMLAECELHGAKGCDGQAKMDAVRARAGLTPIKLTADNLLAERMRELYWEGHRRSDLIRFGKFTGSSYVWSWKGGVEAGTGIVPTRSLYPIPTQFVPTLGQNQGY